MRFDLILFKAEPIIHFVITVIIVTHNRYFFSIRKLNIFLYEVSHKECNLYAHNSIIMILKQLKSEFPLNYQIISIHKVKLKNGFALTLIKNKYRV